MLLVGGDAGIGKTTVVNAVLGLARNRGFTSLVGHCLDIDDGVPLRSVREALRQAVVGRSDDELAPVTRRLSPYLTGDSDAAAVGELGLVVEELVDDGPVLVVLEDLHWADRVDDRLRGHGGADGPGTLGAAVDLSLRRDRQEAPVPLRLLVDLGRTPRIHRL